MKSLVICGATATGKSILAVECAQKLHSEVISADSQLIYRGMDIGTAKPTKKEMDGVLHHIIDVLEPTQGFSVSEYERMATPIIDRLLAEGKTPVICGGTGFYINSLLFDFSYGRVAASSAIREKYTELLRAEGKECLFDRLKQVDPETAENLHPNDTKRIIRALEIYEISGRKKSDLCDGAKVKRDYLAIAIDYPREQLYTRIDCRVDRMFDNGLEDEVKELLSRGIGDEFQSMQAIGYKEVISCLKNNDSQGTMRDIIKKNTRHYAKRQITFFKKMPNLIWLKPEEATADKVLELFNEQS